MALNSYRPRFRGTSAEAVRKEIVGKYVMGSEEIVKDMTNYKANTISIHNCESPHFYFFYFFGYLSIWFQTLLELEM